MEAKEKTMDQSTYMDWNNHEGQVAAQQMEAGNSGNQTAEQKYKAKIIKRANLTLSAIFSIGCMALVLAYMLGVFGNELNMQTFSASLIVFLLLGLKLVDDLSPAVKVKKEQ